MYLLFRPSLLYPHVCLVVSDSRASRIAMLNPDTSHPLNQSFHILYYYASHGFLAIVFTRSPNHIHIFINENIDTATEQAVRLRTIVTQFISHFISLSWLAPCQNFFPANKLALLKHNPSPLTAFNRPTRVVLVTPFKPYSFNLRAPPL